VGPRARHGGKGVSEVQRSRLLGSAVRVLAQEGFERLTVARVTGGARMSRRTFYELFEDREDCFLAVFEDALAHAEAVVRDAYERERGRSWRDRVRAALTALLSLFDERPELRSVLIVDALVAGPRVLARRAQVLERAGGALHRDATSSQRGGRGDLPPLVGEAVVGAVFGLLYARCLEGLSVSVLGLRGTLMGIIVLPYEGPGATRAEVRGSRTFSSGRREARGSRTFSSGRREASSGLKSPTRLADFQARDPLADLPMRMTYRTARVLSVIAEHPGMSNRTIGELAGLSDQGQTSKLLQRLQKLGLIHTTGDGHAHGEPNAWHLTPRGQEVERAVRISPGGDDDARRSSGGARGVAAMRLTGGRVTLVAAIAAAAFALASTPAMAAKEYVLCGSCTFGSEGSEPGKFNGPTSVAVNDSTQVLTEPAAGDVYVVDKGNDRVERFSASGEYKGQFDGSGEYEVEGKKEKGSPPPTGKFLEPEGLAVDNSSSPFAGDVYVADVSHNVVDRFSAVGKYEGQLAGTCPSPGTCSSTELIRFGQLHGVAVDPAGNVWVYETEGEEKGRADEFTAAGETVRSFDTHRRALPGLAVDVHDDIYVVSGEEKALKFLPTGEEAPGFELGEEVTGVALAPAAAASVANDLFIDQGGSIQRYGPFGEVPTGLPEKFPNEGLASSSGLALNAAGFVYASEHGADNVEVAKYLTFPTLGAASAFSVGETSATLHAGVNPEGLALTACRFEYVTDSVFAQEGFSNPGTTSCVPAASEIPADGNLHAVTAVIAGLQVRTKYHFRVTASNTNGARSSTEATFFTPGEPVIEAESVGGITPTGATVQSRIDPSGLPTTYRAEYGPTSVYGSGTAEIDLGAAEAGVGAPVQLKQLEPGTSYHVRIVATNALGTVRSEDFTFATGQSGESLGSMLPDGRVYEVVSPPGDQNAYVPERGQDEDLSTTRPFRASADGTRLAYVGEPPGIGGSGTSSNGDGDTYLATRAMTGGWTANDIEPAGTGLNIQYSTFTSDLSAAVIWSNGPAGEPPLVAGTPAQCFVLYSRNNTTGVIASLFGEPTSFGHCGHPVLAGITANGAAFFLQTEAALVPEIASTEPAEKPVTFGGSPSNFCEEACNLYMVAGGKLSVINIVDTETVAAAYGAPPASPNEPNFSNAVSSDGSHVFWTDLAAGANREHIFLRENGAITIPVSQGAAHFWTATPDGGFAFYTEGEQLWEFDSQGAPGHQRTLLAGEGARVEGVIGASSDGSRLYFVADGVIPPATNAEGKSAAPGQPNLYLYDEGHTRFVATLSLKDNNVEGPLQGSGREYGDWRAGLAAPTATVTTDGESVAFSSILPLTGYNNRAEEEGAVPIPEIFVYDAEADEGRGKLLCASCNPSGLPPRKELGETTGLEQGDLEKLYQMGAFVPHLTFLPSYAVRWMSSNGGRVFFDTSQELVSQDTNHRQNVYEWERDGEGTCHVERGCVYLLSGGAGADDAYLIDASENGGDVFFTSRFLLAPQAENENIKVYDAHLCTSSAPCSLQTSQSCIGTGCQGVPPAAPIFATPASVTFSGSGNLTPSSGLVPSKAAKSKSLTRAEKLAKALRRCEKRYVQLRSKKKRESCERIAHKKYGASPSRHSRIFKRGAHR
jgi:AcrR family transcriptional regulator/DNA-binding MarR family transcriptional regulator